MKMISGGWVGWVRWRVGMKKGFPGKAEKRWFEESQEASEAAVL